MAVAASPNTDSQLFMILLLSKGKYCLQNASLKRGATFYYTFALLKITFLQSSRFMFPVYLKQNILFAMQWFLFYALCVIGICFRSLRNQMSGILIKSHELNSRDFLKILRSISCEIA